MDDVFYSYQIHYKVYSVFLPANWPLTFMYLGRNRGIYVILIRQIHTAASSAYYQQGHYWAWITRCYENNTIIYIVDLIIKYWAFI